MKPILAALALILAAGVYASPPLDYVMPTTMMVRDDAGYTSMQATEPTAVRALALSWRGEEVPGRAIAVMVGPIPHDVLTALVIYVSHAPVTAYVEFPRDGIQLGIGSYVWVQSLDYLAATVDPPLTTYQLVLYADHSLSLGEWQAGRPRPQL